MFDRPLFWPTVMFILLAALVTSVGLLGERNLRALADGFSRVSHSRAVLDEVLAVKADLLEAQSASRGYRLTGEPSFRREFESARDQGRERIDRLRVLLTGDRAQEARVDSLGHESEDLFTFFATLHDVARQLEPAPATRVITARGGKQLVDRIDRRIEAIRVAELAMLETRTARADRTYLIARLAGLALAGASLLLGILVYILFSRVVGAQGREAQEQNRRATELAEADRRKDEFLAMLGHELRNPLAPIRMALHVLDHDAAPAATLARAREILDQQVGQMSRLVNDLMDVSRVALGKLSLECAPTDATALTRAVADAAIPVMADHGHRFELHLPEAPVMASVDAARVRQVLHNLLVNAAKYTERDGTVRLFVRADENLDQVVFRVEDTGRGLSEEERDRVFSPFEQGADALELAEGGIGVGLTLARRLVEMHGGSVRAESPGRGLGSSFEIRLPRNRL
jgi:signal transduction histidine kinase